MDIIGGNDLDPELLSQAEDFIAVPALGFKQFVGQVRGFRLMFHHLQVIIITEDVFVPLNDLFCLLHVVSENCLRQLAIHTAAQADQSFAVLLNEFVTDARFVVIAVNIGFRNYFHQVLVAAIILGQKHQMKHFLLVSSVITF